MSEREQRPLLFAAHLAALWGFAVVQPLLDLLGSSDGAGFFVARGSTSGDIVFFAIAVVVLPPAAAIVLESLVGLVSKRARLALHIVLVIALAGLIVLQLLKHAFGDASSTVLFPVSLVIGAGAALWYSREHGVRSALTVLAAAPAVFLALFIFTSQTEKLIFTNDAAASTSRVTSHTPVVMVSFDEFPITSLEDRAGHIDATRYPHFAAFAHTATWFRNATTVADGTTWATPAVMSGRLPRKGALPTAADYPQNIFTMLGSAYVMHVTEPVTRLCPARLCKSRARTAGDHSRDSFPKRMGSLASDIGLVSLHLVLPDDLRERLPSVSETWGDFAKEDKEESKDEAAAARQAAQARAAQARRAANARGARSRSDTQRDLRGLIPAAKEREARNPAFGPFVRSIKPYARGKPPLYFLHVLLPHHPWHWLPSGRRYGTSSPPIPGLRDNVWNGDAEAVKQGFERHILQVGYVDRALGLLVRKLRSTGLYDKTLIVLTADHGVSAIPGTSRREANSITVGGIASVPFFVKLPGQRQGKAVDTHVQTIDVVPTTAAALGIPKPRQMDGRSALAVQGAGLPRVTIYNTLSVLRFKRRVWPYAYFQAKERQVLARQIALFGTGSWASVYRVGPHRELLGKAVGALATGRFVRAGAQLDRPGELRNFNLRSAYSPSHITGVLSGLGAGRDLAVAVNGRVAGVMRSYAYGGRVRFSAIVPESALHNGSNSVALFAVLASGRGLRLSRL